MPYPLPAMARLIGALMKSIYRLGLGHRYGRTMQTVAGIHYNFSLPEAFWALLQQAEEDHGLLQEFISRRYFDLIRQLSPPLLAPGLPVRRHACRGCKLCGWPPASTRTPWRRHVCSAFCNLAEDGDLGYQSRAQESLHVCYNNSRSYVQSLVNAINTPYPDYEQNGVTDPSGQYQQLNTSLLQIENEFYSSIRPKRTAKSGETALSALCRRGVEYIEVRCIDVDPFPPMASVPNNCGSLMRFYCIACSHPARPPQHKKQQKYC